MNPRLVKFVVELQNSNQSKDDEKYIYFNDSKKKNIFKINKCAKVTVPILKD